MGRLKKIRINIPLGHFTLLGRYLTNKSTKYKLLQTIRNSLSWF